MVSLKDEHRDAEEVRGSEPDSGMDSIATHGPVGRARQVSNLSRVKPFTPSVPAMVITLPENAIVLACATRGNPMVNAATMVIVAALREQRGLAWIRSSTPRGRCTPVRRVVNFTKFTLPGTAKIRLKRPIAPLRGTSRSGVLAEGLER